VSGGLAGTVSPGDAEACPVTDIEGAEDADDAERRGVPRAPIGSKTGISIQ